MSEPKRWRSEKPPAPIARLLAAAEAERPSEASLARSLSALGIGAGTVGAASAAAASIAGGSAGSTAPAGSAATLAGAGTLAAAGAGTTAAAAGAGAKATVLGAATVKWGLLAVALGGSVVAGGTLLKSPALEAPNGVVSAPARTTPASPGTPSGAPGITRPAAVDSPDALDPASALPSPEPSRHAPAPERGPEDPAPAPAPERELGAEVATPERARELGATRPPAPTHEIERSSPASTPERETAHGTPRPATPIDAERLAEEVRAVDRARTLLSQGRSAEALTALKHYEQSFGERRFAPEALYLRMEAELGRGDRPAARRTAAELVKAHPNSPQAPRARQVLASEKP